MCITARQNPSQELCAGSSPRIWVVLGNKLGDNGQVLAIADELGLPYERRDLVMRKRYEVGKPVFRPTLDHLDLERSAKLEPPWPDLVLTSGSRPSMAALWVKQQSAGTCKIAIVGRPKRWLERFDLIVASPQFRVPARPNVLHIQLPLMRLDRARVEAATNRWQDRIDGMPRPLTAVMIGGVTKPFRLDRKIAARLMASLSTVLNRDGGSLYVTTSRRTGAEVANLIESCLHENSAMFRWDRDAAEDNPYHALMNLADRCVVTSDSISMQVEAIKMNKPLAVFALPVGKTPHLWLHQKVQHWLAADGPLGFFGDFLTARGIRGTSRDLPGFQDQLYQSGLAVPLGKPFQSPRNALVDDLALSVQRVRALLPS